MAIRPVFYISNIAPFYKTENIEFQYYSGFAITQKQKSLQSLHTAFLRQKPGQKIMEISSKSLSLLGKELSAFNLMLQTPDGPRHIENVFQSSKVFDNKGPYLDLLDKSPVEAKKDERLKSSGMLTEFRLYGERFPLEPKDFFYNWIYSQALYAQKDRYQDIFEYSAFTDIEFNPKKSMNCQARAVAIFVGLQKAGLLDTAMKSKNAYLETVYGLKEEIKSYEQMTFMF